MIRIEAMTKHYRMGDSIVHALDGVDLAIGQGEFVSITGASGSGKSTLINLIPRFYDVTAGQVLVDGRDIREYDILTFLNRVGFVGQETFIFNASIRENISFGNEHSDEEVVEAAGLADAHEFPAAQKLAQLPDPLLGDDANGSRTLAERFDDEGVVAGVDTRRWMCVEIRSFASGVKVHVLPGPSPVRANHHDAPRGLTATCVP
jgi:predicted ABC-type transport system involved in lysophospholipase L1 biosynthesis ATPase subunit